MANITLKWFIIRVEKDVFTNTNILTLASADRSPTYVTKIELNDTDFATLAPSVGQILTGAMISS